jgi:hypothetical protein
MNKYFLTEHTERCLAQKERYLNSDSEFNRTMANFCESNCKEVLLFCGNEFIYVEYYSCLTEHSNIYDVYLSWIKQIAKNSKISNIETEKGYLDNYDKIQHFRKKGILIKSRIYQFNYFYYNASGRQLAITSSYDFYDRMCDEKILRENYKKTISELKKMGKDYLLEEAEKLYMANQISLGYDSDYMVVKTVDKMLQEIKITLKK